MHDAPAKKIIGQHDECPALGGIGDGSCDGFVCDGNRLLCVSRDLASTGHGLAHVAEHGRTGDHYVCADLRARGTSAGCVDRSPSAQALDDVRTCAVRRRELGIGGRAQPRDAARCSRCGGTRSRPLYAQRLRCSDCTGWPDAPRPSTVDHPRRPDCRNSVWSSGRHRNRARRSLAGQFDLRRRSRLRRADRSAPSPACPGDAVAGTDERARRRIAQPPGADLRHRDDARQRGQHHGLHVHRPNSEAHRTHHRHGAGGRVACLGSWRDGRRVRQRLAHRPIRREPHAADCDHDLDAHLGCAGLRRQYRSGAAHDVRQWRFRVGLGQPEQSPAHHADPAPVDSGDLLQLLRYLPRPGPRFGFGRASARSRRLGHHAVLGRCRSRSRSTGRSPARASHSCRRDRRPPRWTSRQPHRVLARRGSR